MQKVKNDIMTVQGNFEMNIKTLRERFPRSTQIVIGDEFCLLDLTYNDRPEDFGYPCRLDGSMMLFCIKGSVNLSINLNEYVISDGELILGMAGDVINVTKPIADDTAGWHFVMLAMSHGFVTELRMDFRRILDEGLIPFENPTIKLDERTQEIIGDHLKLIAKVTTDNNVLYRDSVRSLTSSMVSVLAECWFAEIGKIKTAKKTLPVDSRTNHKRLVFEQFHKLVSENYSQERLVVFYADKLCLSPKYLSKLVKEVSGKSAPEWIDSYVLLEAKNLLKYSDMPIKEVVYRLNFPNQTVFYKYFKKHIGMTPTDYRKS